MWVEVNCMFSAIAMIILGIIIAFTFWTSIFLAFLGFIVLAMVFMGTFLISYQIKHNHVDVLIDPCPANQEICVLFDYGGNVDFCKVKKGPLGVRQFMKYKKEASIINDGTYQLRFVNGNRGFVGHESYDINVNLKKAKALDKLPGKDIKEIVENLPTIPIAKKEEFYGRI